MPIDILLAEDDPGDACLVREALAQSRLGSRLHVVRDGVELLAFLRREGAYADVSRPNLILLDMNMPRKSGLEALSELKNDHALKSIPVVIFSTSKANEDVVRSYALYANCYVTKPDELPQFIEVVRSIEKYWFGVVTLPPR
jgi:chemotaxis family two-component system response regulator Rcp1